MAGFDICFACYFVVNLGLFIFLLILINLTPGIGIIAIMSGSLFGWGIGIVAHFVSVIAGPSEKRVQKEFKKLKNK